MLASDLNNPEFLGAHDPGMHQHVEFYPCKPFDKWHFETTGEKRFLPEVPYVRIVTPGDDRTITDRPANQRDADAYPRQWLRYQMSQGQIAQSGKADGWALSEWSELNPELVRHLNHLRFYTVEQLAHASDLALQGIGMGAQGFKQKAVAALAQRNGMAAQTEIAKRDDIIADQGKQIAELRTMMENLVGKKAKAA